MNRTIGLFAALAALTLASGCVTTKKHEAILESLAAVATRAGDLEGRLQACEGDLSSSRADAERLAGVAEERDELLAELTAARERLSQLDEDYSEAQARHDSTRMLLDGAREALHEARRRAAESDARDRIHARLREELRGMIDAGKLSVRVERGRLVLDLRQDVLFASGRATLSPDGGAVVAEVAQALAAFPDRRFQVEGHTDDVPISSARFASNWELSTARAVAVVRVLLDGGVAPASLSAAGFGEHQPRADNGTADGRARNRRIEIVMLPDLDPLPDLVEGL